ncbi:hypothetical protein DFH09DRAFT_1089474 [Mycena vulgaris]|nr:hypothetical protein DFH09DRAFT_1089474 [Mycena vulgaris]
MNPPPAAGAGSARFGGDARYGGGGDTRYGGGGDTRYSGGGGGDTRTRYSGAPHDAEADEDAEFVPTLARRSITASASTASGVAMGAGSPGRYTSPLPAAGSPGRYATPPSPGRYTSPLPPSPGRYTSPLPPAAGAGAGSGSPGRYTSAFHARARSSSFRGGDSPAPSYRMGVHVAAGTGYRRDSGDVADRFVLPRSGASSVVSVPSPMRESEYAPSEREREREREMGVPIGAGIGGGFGGLGGLGGVSGSERERGVSGSGPSAIAINPFKSNTLSRSSLSGSLLRGAGTGSPGRATSPIAAGSVPSPIAFPDSGSGGSAAGSVGTGGGGGGMGIPMPMRKRYSSSFPHRYGSVGSGGSSESGSLLGPRERTASGSRSGGGFQKGAQPGAGTDAQHEDISAFVKDIDAARPLLGRSRLEQRERAQEQQREQDEDGSSSPGTSRGGTVRGSSIAGARTLTLDALAPAPSGAMLTSESEVDERLKRMNEEFVRSLVGLGGRGAGAGLTRSPVSAGGVGGDGQGSQEVIGRMDFDFEGGR